MTSNDGFDIIFQLKDYRCHLKLCPTRPLSSLGHNIINIYAPSCSSQTHEGCQAHPYHPSKIESAALPKSGIVRLHFVLILTSFQKSKNCFLKKIVKSCHAETVSAKPPILCHQLRVAEETRNPSTFNKIIPACHHHVAKGCQRSSPRHQQ